MSRGDFASSGAIRRRPSSIGARPSEHRGSSRPAGPRGGSGNARNRVRPRPPGEAPRAAPTSRMPRRASSADRRRTAGGEEPNARAPVDTPPASTAARAHAGAPADKDRVAECEAGPYAGIADRALRGLAGLEPADADPSEVAGQIVRAIDMPFRKRPTRVNVDPSQDGAEVVNAVADRMRCEMYRNIGLEALLSPRRNG